MEDGHVSDTSKLKEGEEDPVEQTEEAPRKIARGNRGSEAVKRKPTAAKKQRRDVEPDEDGTPQKKKPRTKSGITKRTPVKSVKETVPEEPESDVEDTNKESSATSGVEAPIEIENEDDAAAAPVQPITDASESEMSEVLDLTPKKKKASRSGSVAVPKSKPKSKASSEAATEKRSTKKKEGPELSADDEKIKSLQGWLLKCGVGLLPSRPCLTSC